MNPHGCPQEPETCASANFATSAKQKNYNVYLKLCQAIPCIFLFVMVKFDLDKMRSPKKRKAKKLSKVKLWSIISISVVAFVAVALIIINIFVPVKYLAVYCVSRNRVQKNEMRVSFIDVGFGDCTVIELPDGKNMLIDAGNGSFTNTSKVIKALNKRDIDIIDYLICSSVNTEHCGGLAEIIKYKTVKNVYMPYCKNKYINDGFRKFYDETVKNGVQIIYSEYNAGVREDEYFFTFLSPSVKEFDGGEYSQLNENPTKSARNNSSAVLWLEYNETAFLFTSDVETKVLNSIVTSYELIGEDYPVKLEKCKVVQVANHGSDVSACPQFYDLINPEYAIISVGENGSGCPSIKTISDVINSVGENLYRTDECGTVTVKVSAEGYTVQ